jgi:hypothetical protein
MLFKEPFVTSHSNFIRNSLNWLLTSGFALKSETCDNDTWNYKLVNKTSPPQKNPKNINKNQTNIQIFDKLQKNHLNKKLLTGIKWTATSLAHFSVNCKNRTSNENKRKLMREVLPQYTVHSFNQNQYNS